MWSSQNNNDSYSGKTVYLPASIKTIGKNAFFPRNEKNLSHFICEPTSRPSGWDPNWCTIGELARFMSWGFSYYITDNYDMYYIVNDNPIITACYEGNLRYDVTDLVIPETINVNGFECSVVGIKRVGNSGGVLKSVTIPKSIMFIDSKAFKGCRDLKEVEFADEYDYLFFGDFIFGFCDSLKSIVLPKGLVNLSDGMFQGANSLTSVKVPNTVRSVAGDIFYGCSQDITVDLTSYQSADSIAECNNEMLDDYSGTITFKIKNGLTEEEFVAKGWPKADGSGTPTVVWETVSTLNA